MSKSILSLLALALLFLAGCKPKSTTPTLPDVTPLYYSDYADSSMLSDQPEAVIDANVVFIQPTLVFNWGAKDEITEQLVTLGVQRANIDALYTSLAGTKLGKVFSQGGTFYWFAPEIITSNVMQKPQNTGTWVLQTPISITQDELVQLQPADTTTPLLLSKQSKFTFIGNNVTTLEALTSNPDKLEALTSRTFQFLSLDFHLTLDMVDSISRELTSQLSSNQTEPLIQVLLSSLRNINRVSLYLAPNNSSQQVLISLALKSTPGTLVESLFNNSIATPGDEGAYLSPKNAVEYQIGALNNASLIEYLKSQPESSKDIIRLIIAHLSSMSGTMASVKSQDNKGQELSTAVFSLVPERAGAYLRLLDQTNIFLNNLLNSYSMLARPGVMLPPDNKGVYSYTPPQLINSPAPDPYYFSVSNDKLTFSNSRILLDQTLYNIATQTKLSPSVLSTANLNPFTISSATNYLPSSLPFMGGKEVPITSSLEARNGELTANIGISKDWLNFFIKEFSMLTAPAVQAPITAPATK